MSARLVSVRAQGRPFPSRWLGVIGLLSAACVGAWWVWGGESSQALQEDAAQRAHSQISLQAFDAGGVAAASRSLALTEKDELVTPDLIRIFDQILLQCTAKDQAGILAQARNLLPQYVPQTWLVRALALLERYVEYRFSLGEIPEPDLSRPDTLRSSIALRKRLRERFFGADDAHKLFDADERHDYMTADRLDIYGNKNLSDEQRKQALAATEKAWLTEAEREQRRSFVSHQTSEQLDQSMDQRGLSDTQRLTERTAAFGAEAAQRLAQLDQSERDFDQRLAQYAAAADAQKEVVAQRLFSETERLRLDAALSLRKSK